jgi:hypothetical protein
MRKYLARVIPILALVFTSLGLSAGLPSTAITSHSLASTASGQCSKAEAIEAVKRLGLSDVSANYPVWKVLCGAFTGAGGQAMVASISGSENVGLLYWAVFRWSGSDWRLVVKQRRAATLTAAGSDIRETVSIYRSGDPRCCPSGGTKTRIWHWNGSRLLPSPWNQSTKSEPDVEAFHTPSGNISCGMADYSGLRTVGCQSRVPSQKVTMDAVGRLTICRGSFARCKMGDAGDVPTLAYGRHIAVGRFRCQSMATGVRCTVISSGKGFLINRAGVSRVGP